MALPSSGPIGIGAIYQELTGSAVEGPTQVSKCFNGIYATINPNSPAQPSPSTPYSLGSFHGYAQNSSSGIKIMLSQQPLGDPQTACFVGPQIEPQALWCSTSTPHPEDFLYYDQALTQGFDGQDQWWYNYDLNVAFLIKGDGKIVDQFQC